jgi:hypothetical protein
MLPRMHSALAAVLPRAFVCAVTAGNEALIPAQYVRNFDAILQKPVT